MKIRLVDAARHEFDEAIDYYSKHSGSAVTSFIDLITPASPLQS